MSMFNHGETEQFRRSKHLSLDLRHKKCAAPGCNAQIKAKWIVQQGGFCDKCWKSKQLSTDGKSAPVAQGRSALRQGEVHQ